MLNKLIVNFLYKRGYTLKNSKSIDRIINYYDRVLEKNRSLKLNNSVSTLVFSKDRAMQLYAFIESFQEMVDNNFDELYVFYKCSNDTHKRSYLELIELFKDKVIFVEESNFRTDLINLINIIHSKVIGVFVDDMVFIDRVDYNQISKIDTSKYTLSLSRGKDLLYSVPLSREITLPVFS
jgi:hypothetical protein